MSDNSLQIQERVIELVVENLSADPEQVTLESSFVDDLNADSLDTVELVMAFEEAFDIDISDEGANTIQTVGDAVTFIKQEKEKKEKATSS